MSTANALEPLTCPADRPRRPEPTLTVAYVAHWPEDGLAQRYLARLFRKSGLRTVQRHLRLLIEQNWLEVADPGHGPIPTRYRLGGRARKEAEAWANLGAALFGPRGLLAALLTRAALVKQVLGPSGVLVAGLLLRDGGHSCTSAVRRFGGLLSRNTVRRRLAELTEAGLAVWGSGGEVSLAEGFFDRLRCLERESGAALVCARQDRLFASERARFRQGLAKRGRWVASPGEASGCVFGCGRVADTDEHFPPRHWGCPPGDPRFVWRACRTCNSKSGRLIRDFPKPDVRCSGRAVVSGESAERTYLTAFGAYLNGDREGVDRARRLVGCYLDGWVEALPQGRR